MFVSVSPISTVVDVGINKLPINSTVDGMKLRVQNLQRNKEGIVNVLNVEDQVCGVCGR